MELTKLPVIKEWNEHTIDMLPTAPGAESETLEYKREISRNSLPKAICAMANTSGGFIVIGIEELKNSDEEVINYVKKGINGNPDELVRIINDFNSNIDPWPEIKVRDIKYKDDIYIVIQIIEQISSKPFFLKSENRCYVRISNSSRPATRHIIGNLFAGTEYKKNISLLKSSIILLKNQLKETMYYINAISIKDLSFPAPVDLSIIKMSAVNNQEFLIENELFGEYYDNGLSHGIVTVIQTIEKLNVYLKQYNRRDVNDKELIKNFLTKQPFVLAREICEVDEILDKIVVACKEYINNTN